MGVWGSYVSGSLSSVPQSSRTERHPSRFDSRGFFGLLARIYRNAELRLTCADRAEGRSERGRGRLSVGTRALPGKRSGTAAFPSICTVTRALWKEEGKRCACPVYLNLSAQVCMFSCAAV